MEVAPRAEEKSLGSRLQNSMSACLVTGVIAGTGLKQVARQDGVGVERQRSLTAQQRESAIDLRGRLGPERHIRQVDVIDAAERRRS